MSPRAESRGPTPRNSNPGTRNRQLFSLGSCLLTLGSLKTRNPQLFKFQISNSKFQAQDFKKSLVSCLLTLDSWFFKELATLQRLMFKE